MRCDPVLQWNPPSCLKEVERVHCARFRFCVAALGGLGVATMTHELEPVLTRIAEALERLAPARAAEPAFAGSRLFRHEPASGGFHPAPDYPLPLAALVGVERQRDRFVENLQ